MKSPAQVGDASNDPCLLYTRSNDMTLTARYWLEAGGGDR